jgi:hypothetical protein
LKSDITGISSKVLSVLFNATKGVEIEVVGSGMNQVVPSHTTTGNRKISHYSILISDLFSEMISTATDTKLRMGNTTEFMRSARPIGF